MTAESHGYKGTFFMMKWGSQPDVSGGYTSGSTDLTTYAQSPEGGHRYSGRSPLGLLTIAFWQSDATLKSGKPTEIQSRHRARRDRLQISLYSSSTSEHFLVPGKDVIVATLTARDRDGKPLRQPDRSSRAPV